MPSDNEPSAELVALAHLSMRSGIPLPDLIDMEPIYLQAYFVALYEQAEAEKG